MPFVEANGLSLYFEQDARATGPESAAGVESVESVESVEREPLLFISGTGGDLRNRPNQFDSPLAEAFELICYDQRGLGQSDKPEGSYTMADYADDAAALMTALGYERLPVVGVSFGGMVAQELALRHPERVSSLVLACTSAGGEGGASFPLHELADLPDEERASRHLQVADLRHTDEWIAANPEAWRQRLALTMAAQRPDRDEAGARRQLEARRDHNTFARLKALDLPVLLVGGEYDGIAPIENMQALAQRIYGSELQFFAGGHLFLIQDKAAYPYIIQWLREKT